MTDISKKDINAAKNWYYKQYARGEHGMFSEFVEIDPAKATVMLEHNPENRSISPATVDKYASDMRDKRWKANGEAIILAKTGELNTGQHRLKAIIKSGKTISIMAYEQFGHINASRISKPAILERIQADPLINQMAAWVSSNSARLSAMRMAKKLTGFLYYRASNLNKAKADEFFDLFKTGAGLEQTHPVFVLRDKLMTRPQMNDTERMEIFVNAWNAWVDNKEINPNYLNVRGSIPEMKTPKR